jgi:hypothetical protein
LFLEHLEITPERHALLVIVQKVRNARRGGTMSPEDFVLLVFSRPSGVRRDLILNRRELYLALKSWA